MKKGKTSTKKSQEISETKAIVIVAAYAMAFILGAVVPFVVHADNNHNSQDQGGGNHQNHDIGHDGDNHDNDGHDGDSHHDNHDGDDNGHDGDTHDGHDGDSHGHDNDDHDGHGHDGDDDEGDDDNEGGENIPQTGGIQIIKNTVGGNGTFSFGGSNSFSITTLNGTGESDFFNVTPGSYTLTESVPDGWTMTSNSCSEGFTVTANATTTCTVVNTKNPVTPPGDGGDEGDGQGGGGGEITPPPPPPPPPAPSGGGNGPIAGSLTSPVGNGPIVGSVLGASTTTLPELPAGCTALLSGYLHIGWNNDPEQVKKLQEFLNKELGLNIPVTGFFGKQTFEAVMQFQKMHEPEVLTPWGIDYSTGFVYKTTQRWINLTTCSSLSIPMPELN